MKLSQVQTDRAFDYGYLLSRIWPYVKPVLPRIIIGLLLVIPLGLLDGATAFALKPYIDVVINGNEMVVKGFTLTRDILAAVIPWAVIMFAVVQGLLKYINCYLTDWISLTISNRVKIELFEKLVTMDTSFYDDNSSGLVLSRFISDPETASKSIVDAIKTLVTTATSALGLIAVLLYNSWHLAVVGIIVLVCAFIPMSLIRKHIKKVSNQSMVVGSSMTTNVNETYHGNKIIAGYCLQEDMKARFRAQIRQLFTLTMSLTKRVSWLSPLMYLIASFGIAVVMIVGNHLVMSGNLTTGSLASFITSLLLLYKPIKTLSSTLTSLQTIFVAMNRVFELFDIDTNIKEDKNAKKLEEVKEKITFENVCFEYIENKPVLKNINLEVKKGEIVALVGNSGGGKSTIVNLLPRFYDVKSGSIKIDGVDLREFNLTSLRNNISEVFQDNFLFSGTIESNILMGKKHASEQELKQVIEAAHLDEFINSLELGVKTEIGERGTSLSGGQRQRVAIARAMIKNAPILILDEATSALDNKSEAIVQKALENLIKGRTVFVIAHRLSTIKNADKIVVINEGEIVEVGTHEELVTKQDGHYKYLYEMQFAKSENVEQNA